MILLLASASPRRRELLADAGIAFRCVPSGVPEEAPADLPPAEVARSLAVAKARAVAATAGEGPAVVLGADTVVALPGGRLLGKPADEAEAAEHLRALAGTVHEVITGVCLLDLPGGAEEVFHGTTRVTMRPLSPAEIAAYARSGEGRDKAGGYAIQETADRFVTGLEGARTNVVGLPMEDLLPRLARRGIRP